MMTRLFLALVILLAANQCAHAAEPVQTMPESHVLYLLKAAVALSGYDMPAHKLPTVYEMSSDQMHRAGCVENPDCENIIGYYRDGDEIWIDAQWAQENPDSNISEDSIAVHELTHWLQAREGAGVIGFGVGCARSQAREVEAYHVQERYIREYEHKSMHMSNQPQCEESK